MDHIFRWTRFLSILFIVGCESYDPGRLYVMPATNVPKEFGGMKGIEIVSRTKYQWGSCRDYGYYFDSHWSCTFDVVPANTIPDIKEREQKLKGTNLYRPCREDEWRSYDGDRTEGGLWMTMPRSNSSEDVELNENLMRQQCESIGGVYDDYKWLNVRRQYRFGDYYDIDMNKFRLCRYFWCSSKKESRDMPFYLSNSKSCPAIQDLLHVNGSTLTPQNSLFHVVVNDTKGFEGCKSVGGKEPRAYSCPVRVCIESGGQIKVELCTERIRDVLQRKDNALDATSDTRDGGQDFTISRSGKSGIFSTGLDPKLSPIQRARMLSAIRATQKSDNASQIATAMKTQISNFLSDSSLQEFRQRELQFLTPNLKEDPNFCVDQMRTCIPPFDSDIGLQISYLGEHFAARCLYSDLDLFHITNFCHVPFILYQYTPPVADGKPKINESCIPHSTQMICGRQEAAFFRCVSVDEADHKLMKSLFTLGKHEELKRLAAKASNTIRIFYLDADNKIM